MGKGELLFSVFLDDNGQIDMDIREVTNQQDAERLENAAATLLASLAQTLAEQSSPDTPLVCHAGCSFAGMIELAHKRFADMNEAEYRRVVSAGLLTKAASAGTAH